MQNDEANAAAHLKSIGCTIETSGGHTSRVSFDDCVNVTHDDLHQLAFLPRLQRVCFYSLPVNDDILSSLTCIESLSSINLNCTAVTISDIMLIERFPNLTMVGLMATSANDDCTNTLLSCRKITNLRIDDTQITPNGTAQLAETLDLDTFWIGGTQLSPESLATIAKLPRLREFNVCGESVVDSHVDALLTFAKPERLFIRNTRISDSGLSRLSEIDPHVSNVG